MLTESKSKYDFAIKSDSYQFLSKIPYRVVTLVYLYKTFQHLKKPLHLTFPVNRPKIVSVESERNLFAVIHDAIATAIFISQQMGCAGFGVSVHVVLLKQ